MNKIQNKLFSASGLLALNISQFSPIPNTGAYSDVDTLVNGKVTTLLNFVIGTSALVAVVMMIVAGYLFITAAGDPDKIEKAQKTITAAVIGLIVVFVARALVVFILSIING